MYETSYFPEKQFWVNIIIGRNKILPKVKNNFRGCQNYNWIHHASFCLPLVFFFFSLGSGFIQAEAVLLQLYLQRGNGI